MIPTVFGVILITFVLFNVVGGSPALMTLGRHVSPQMLEEFDEIRGFNKPLILGLWAETRTYEVSDFKRNAGPWREVDGVTHHPDTDRDHSHIILAPDMEYAIPLAFPPRAGTSFRWTLEYRLSSDGSASFIYDKPESEENDISFKKRRIDIPYSDRWRKITLPFNAGEQPDELNMRLTVEGAPIEIMAMELERRADHILDSQFVFFIRQLARMDLGTSHVTNQPVTRMIREGIGPSLKLTVPIFFVGLFMAISLSLICAFYRNSMMDRMFIVLAVALMSINYLVWIVVGQYLLAYQLGWFPVWGFETITYLALPIIIGVISGLGTDLRFYRTVMLDEMYKEYVRTAFAKGMGRGGVLFKHVLKNAMITVITNIIIAIPFLYTGSLLLESFFGIPGLGYMGIEAINSSDVDVIRAIVLIGAVLYVAANLLTDICYAWVDPRVQLK